MPNYIFALALWCIIAKAFAMQDEVLSLKYICTKRDKIREYDLRSTDWLSEDYESTLIAFVPDAGLENILQNHIGTT